MNMWDLNNIVMNAIEFEAYFQFQEAWNKFNMEER